MDSEIVRAMINKESYGFRTFAANRIGEIQELTEKENWHWIEGNLNIADLTTRPFDGTSRDLGADGEWQNGPSFLKQPTDMWPIKSESKASALPEVKQNFVGAVSTPESASIASRIRYERFSNLKRLLRTTAWIEKLQRKYKRSRADEKQDPYISPSDMSHAEETLIKHVQEEMRTDVDKGKYKKLLPTTENCIIVVGGRAEKWISSTLNREKFILLPAKHRLSVLIAEKAHVTWLWRQRLL